MRTLLRTACCFFLHDCSLPLRDLKLVSLLILENNEFKEGEVPPNTVNRRGALGEPLLVAEHHFPNSMRSQTTAKDQRLTLLTLIILQVQFSLGWKNLAKIVFTAPRPQINLNFLIHCCNVGRSNPDLFSLSAS